MLMEYVATGHFLLSVVQGEDVSLKRLMSPPLTLCQVVIIGSLNHNRISNVMWSNVHFLN